MAEETLLRRGPEREDERAALIAYTAVMLKWNGKGREPKLEDFLPKERRAKLKPQTTEEMIAIAKMLAATHSAPSNKPATPKQVNSGNSRKPKLPVDRKHGGDGRSTKRRDGRSK